MTNVIQAVPAAEYLVKMKERKKKTITIPGWREKKKEKKHTKDNVLS